MAPGGAAFYRDRGLERRLRNVEAARRRVTSDFFEDNMHAPEIGKQSVARAERRGARVDTIDRSGVLARTMLGVPIKFGAGGEIYGEGEPIEYVYEVIHGAARTIKILSDGRRKIGGFYFAGDIFGLEEGQEHRLSAEAIADSVVCVIKRRTLLRMAGYDRDLARQLLAVTSRELTRVQHHSLMLIETAQERVSSFLLEMVGRISVGDLIVLPMSRQDIADYLGVTIETVSRTFTILENTSAIAMPNSRAVVLRDRAALWQ